MGDNAVTSEAFLAELSVKAPRKLIIFIEKKIYIYRIKVSQKKSFNFVNTASLAVTGFVQGRLYQGERHRLNDQC